MPESSAGNANSRTISEAMSTTPSKILLIDYKADDYVKIRDIVEQIDHGMYTVDWVPSFGKGMQYVRQQTHDVYLLDCRLGERSGLDFITEALEAGCSAPLIFLTGEAEYELAIEALKAGAADYLIKSELDPFHLDHAVRHAVERHRSDLAVNRSEASLKAFFNNAVSLFILLDRKFAIQAFNTLAYTWTLENVNIKLCEDDYFLDVVPREMHPSVMKILQASLRGEVNRHERFLFGRWYDVCYMPVLEGASVVGISFSATDIHERKHAETALKENEYRYRQLVENASDIIYKTNSLGNFVYVNPVAQRLLGYTEQEFLSKNYLELIRPGWRRRVEAFYENQLSRRISNTYFEFPTVAKSGSEVWIGQNVRLIEQNREVLGFDAVARDITERIRISDALQREKEALQMCLDTADAMFLIIDHDERVRLINRKGCEILGYDEADVIGKNWFEHFVLPAEVKQLRAVFGKLMGSSATGVEKYENTVLTKSGATRLIDWHNSVIRDPANRIVSTFSSGIDITDQRIAEQKLNKMNSELEQRVKERTTMLNKAIEALERSNKELTKAEEDVRSALIKEKELGELKSRFVSTASHEFRTPLAAILSSASLLAKYNSGGNEDRRAKHINRIKSSVQNLRTILDDFLSLSKLEEGKVVLKPGPVDCIKFFEELRDEMQTIAKAGQVIRYRNLGGPLVLNTDIQLLKIVFVNLVGNAIKYSPESSSIEIVTGRHNNNMYCMVKDEGIGIPEADQEHIFIRFFRAQNALASQGTGLGLNIVKKYVELMNGSISFESQEGQGASFTIELPMESKTK